MSTAARLLIVADPRLSARAIREAERLIAAAEARIVRFEPGLVGARERARLPLAGADRPATGRQRDFLVAAALAEHGRAGVEGAAIPIAVELSSSARHGRVTVAPAGTFAGLRALLAPPPVSVDCSGPRAGDEALLAARILAELVAAPAGPGLGGELEQRLAARCEAWIESAGVAADSSEAAFAAWAGAWRGLADGDEARLRAACNHFARLASDGVTSGPARMRALADQALVSLALGGVGDGAERLATGLESARAALALLDRDGEPALIASVAALAGRLAAALGIERGDRALLREAGDALRMAMRLAVHPWLAGACGLDGLEALLADVERASRAPAAARQGESRNGRRMPTQNSGFGSRPPGPALTRAAR